MFLPEDTVWNRNDLHGTVAIKIPTNSGSASGCQVVPKRRPSGRLIEGPLLPKRTSTSGADPKAKLKPKRPSTNMIMTNDQGNLA